jgi:hypothetical protein
MTISRGQTHFHYTGGIVSVLAENGRIPKLLVDGIVSGGRAHRFHELTPPSSAGIDNRFSLAAVAFLIFETDLSLISA